LNAVTEKEETEILKNNEINVVSRVAHKKLKIGRSKINRENEKLKNYLTYQPADAFAESSLAVERKNFDAQARYYSVDISADDDKGLYMQNNQKRWLVCT